MEQNAIKSSNESNHGLRELRDFTNFFSYSGRTVSESIGSNRTLKQDELKAKYPLAKSFMEKIKKLSNYLKTHGGGTNANEYAFRIPHIEAMKEFIDVCHGQGIAVVMDIALNHSFGLSPMVQLYWDAVNNRPAANNPWFNPV